MAAPSIAAGYPNSDAPSSQKKGEYTYDQALVIIAESGAPTHVRQLTQQALIVRGDWPNRKGPVTNVITVSVRSLQDKSGVWRSTIQRRIQRAKKDGYWREVRPMNSWLNCPKCGAEREEAKCPKCPHKGNGRNPEEFRTTVTYAVDLEKFERTPPCRQVREIRELRARRDPRGVTEMPRRAPEQSPPPKEQAPAQREERANGRALGPSQRRELAERINVYERGNTAIRDVNGYLVQQLDPGAPSYIKPMPRVAAVLAACESMDRGDPKWNFAALRISRARAMEAAIEMGEVIPTGGSLGAKN